MDTSCEDFVQQFKFGLIQVVFEWARGMPFNEITDLTDVQEGKVSRVFLRVFSLTENQPFQL
jgi:antiviral helicase SKI2